jgi:hypothetical protein
MLRLSFSSVRFVRKFDTLLIGYGLGYELALGPGSG